MFKMSKHKLWDGDDNIEYGLVHIAAFLAQAMEEGIKANTCEELNAGHPHEVQKNKTVYSASAACGQGNELYENRGCSEEDEEAYMACNVNPDMILRAKVLSNWDDAPPGFFCAPRKYLPLAPRWVVHGLTCNSSSTSIDNITEYISYVKKEGRCRDYKQINSAGWSYADCNERRCPGPTGRVHVQGCCWWGRGVLLTSGVCTLGKLNTYLREIPELTPPENLCLNPSAVCDNRYPYLKWILGLFDYVSNVQDYAGGDWEYKTALKNWVNNGKSRNDPKFIDIASKVFKSGSPAGIANEASQRVNNFFEVLKIFGQYKEGE
ncbi:uncharacterized protein LOC135121785 [Zophobas morio]|uniref:uncharacterized protein LOC135121785 n=1 Tax=Zophobas morio TaxID=2755281 RepID=UPI003083E62E